MPPISAPSTLSERSTSLVTFKILSAGDDITTRISVVGIAITRMIGRVSSAVLTIADGDIPRQTMPVSDSDWFLIGKEIEIKTGYHMQEETVFKGIVVKHQVKVLKNKPIQLLVECKDTLIKTTTRRRSAYFYEQTDKDIIEQILSDYSGIETDIDNTTLNHASLVQYFSSDWDFIVSRAESQGLLVWTDDGKLLAKKPDFSASPKLTLSYASGQIIEFEANIEARNSFSNVEATTWDSADQRLAHESADEPSGFSEQGNISASDIASALHEATTPLLKGGEFNAAELQLWADAHLHRSRLAKVRGRVAVIGTAAIKPMDWISLDKMGSRFQGKAMVSAINHEILRGLWTTHIEFGLAPQFFSETTPDIAAPPAAGLVPAVHGLHIGIVKQLEGDDTGGGGRIKVLIPYIDAQSEGIWARLSHVTAGNNRGFVFRPELEDEVIVGFLNDDPREAIVLGSLYAINNPAPIEPQDDNNEKGIVFRGGMKMMFNDEDKTVTIITEQGNQIVINDNEQSIKIEDQRGAKLAFESSGITLDAGSGQVVIKGSMVKINS
jgi:Rhs element Vgr protein